MNLFMVEIAVSNIPTSLAWYCDHIGLTVDHHDEANGFVLLKSSGGRLALKRGTPAPDGVILHFSVVELDNELTRLLAAGVHLISSIKASDEGYRRAIVVDPDQYRVCLFEVVTPTLQRA